MSVYVLASIAVDDREEYGRYQAGFLDVFTRYRGELLAVSDEPRVIEGEWPYTRAVVIRFPDETEARRWYESPEYQRIARHRWNASRGVVVALDDGRPAASAAAREAVEHPQKGGCPCGEIRYALTREPLTLYACHCTDCQRETGTSFALSMWVELEALELVAGTPQQFEIELSDGRTKASKGCGRCAVRLWNEPPAFPGMAVLRPGTLDDTSWFEPVAHIWTRSAQRGVIIPDDVLRFDQQPRVDEIPALLEAWKQRAAR